MKSRGWKNQTLERERCPRRTRSLWGALLCCAVALTPWGVWLAQHNECIALTHAVAKQRAEQERLDKLERRLRVEAGALQTLSRIESWAESQGALVRPEAEHVVILPATQPMPNDLVARTGDSTGAGRPASVRAAHGAKEGLR